MWVCVTSSDPTLDTQLHSSLLRQRCLEVHCRWLPVVCIAPLKYIVVSRRFAAFRLTGQLASLFGSPAGLVTIVRSFIHWQMAVRLTLAARTS